jgi:hypothetical protein
LAVPAVSGIACATASTAAKHESVYSCSACTARVFYVACPVCRRTAKSTSQFHSLFTACCYHGIRVESRVGSVIINSAAAANH